MVWSPVIYEKEEPFLTSAAAAMPISVSVVAAAVTSVPLCKDTSICCCPFSQASRTHHCNNRGKQVLSTFRLNENKDMQ